MAFDNRKLKTMKWLEKIATKECKGYSAYRPDSIQRILCRFGRLYASDGFILACVDYPEHDKQGNIGYEEVKAYQDENGKLLSEIVFDETQGPSRNGGFFENYIPAPRDYCNVNEAPPFDPLLLSLALEPFKYNNLDTHFGFTPEKCVISGHNRDVSILIVIMGKRH